MLFANFANGRRANAEDKKNQDNVVVSNKKNQDNVVVSFMRSEEEKNDKSTKIDKKKVAL